jgi:hypothetical protein
MAKIYGNYSSGSATLIITANPAEIKIIKCRLKFKTNTIFGLTFIIHFIFFINANVLLIEKKKFSNFGLRRTKPVSRKLQNQVKGIWKYKKINLETFPTVSTAVPCSEPGSVLSNEIFSEIRQYGYVYTETKIASTTKKS